MSWFTLVDPASGRTLSPLEVPPTAPLQLFTSTALRLSRCEGAVVREELDAALARSWVVTPSGPFTLVLSDVALGETTVRFDGLTEVSATMLTEPPAEPAAAEEAEPATPLATPPLETALADAAPPWQPGTIAVMLLADPEASQLADDWLRRATACRAAVVELLSVVRADGSESEATDTALRIVDFARETGRAPEWGAELATARAQRSAYEATLARAGGVIAETSRRSERGAAEAIYGLLLEATARVDTKSAHPPSDPVEALGTIVREMEAASTLIPSLLSAVRAVRGDASLRGEVRGALLARDALRALGCRS